MKALSVPAPGLTLAEVARDTGLTRAAARRFLLTLAELGYVRVDGRRFALTPRVLELGHTYLSSLTLPELAQPHLRELVEQVHESSSMSVLDGSDIVYVAREPTRRIMTVAIAVGTRFPAHVTSMGRVLLSDMAPDALDGFLDGIDLEPLTAHTLTTADAIRSEIERVRRQGYAIVDQELEQGLRSVAVPVREPRGGAVAAVNVSAHATRKTLEGIRRDLLPPLRATAARIEADLSGYA
jgi:IclR family pca regulon transcriptional regulator